MSNRFRMADTDMEESPPTIAYTLLVLLSAIYDFDIHLFGDELMITDDESGAVLAVLEVDPVWGELLLAVLSQANEEVSGSQWKTTSPFSD